MGTGVGVKLEKAAIGHGKSNQQSENRETDSRPTTIRKAKQAEHKAEDTLDKLVATQ